MDFFVIVIVCLIDFFNFTVSVYMFKLFIYLLYVLVRLVFVLLLLLFCHLEARVIWKKDSNTRDFPSGFYYVALSSLVSSLLTSIFLS